MRGAGIESGTIMVEASPPPSPIDSTAGSAAVAAGAAGTVAVAAAGAGGGALSTGVIASSDEAGARS